VSGVAEERPILIVDDDRELRDVLLVLCELRGRQAVAVPTAEEALTRMRAGLRPALIVFDLVMPGKGGWSFAPSSSPTRSWPTSRQSPSRRPCAGTASRRCCRSTPCCRSRSTIDQLLVLIDRYGPAAELTGGSGGGGGGRRRVRGLPAPLRKTRRRM